jgi:uncharacterized protein YjbI with pentapeptide repeats
MANEEHLEILKQGSEMWNQWRCSQRNKSADLRGAILSKMDLDDYNLRDVDLDHLFFNPAS